MNIDDFWSTVFVGVINGSCSLSNFPECKLPINYIYFFIALLFSFLLAFVCVVLLREKPALHSMGRDKGILFCIISLIALELNSLGYITSLHIFFDLTITKINKLKKTINFIDIFPIVIYFNEINRILVLFDVKFAKLLCIFSIALILILGFLSLSNYLSIFIDLGIFATFLANVLKNILYVKQAVYVIEYFMLCYIFSQKFKHFLIVPVR